MSLAVCPVLIILKWIADRRNIYIVGVFGFFFPTLHIHTQRQKTCYVLVSVSNILVSNIFTSNHQIVVFSLGCGNSFRGGCVNEHIASQSQLAPPLNGGNPSSGLLQGGFQLWFK